jgi:hypothetical protein
MKRMEDLKQAYETLGLQEDASREQVEQRYYLLLKKARSKQSNLDEINTAYKRIIGYESEKASPAVKQGKADYFFYYYKWHVLGAVILILVILFTAKGMIDRRNEEAAKPPLDLAVTVFGDFFTTETGNPKLSQHLLSLVPEWKRIDVGVTYVPTEMRSQQDMALQQKAMLTIMTEKMDLMILDERNFDMLAKQGGFVPLDTLPFWSELQRSPDRIRSALAQEERNARPYGVDITDHPVFQDVQLGQPSARKILALRLEPAHPDNARKMMELLTAL